MTKIHRLPAILAAGLIALAAISGCGGKPESELETLIDKVVQKDFKAGGKVWAPIDYSIIPQLQPYGEEAIAALMAALDDCPTYVQPSYSTVITLINAEPARFEACKKLLNHPNNEVRKDAVEGFVGEGAPDEAIELCISLISESEDSGVRCVALYALRYCKNAKFHARICKAFRSATADTNQMVREHAFRSLDQAKFCR